MGDGVGVQTDLAAWLLAQVQADLDALDQMFEYDCDAGGHWMYDRIRVECDTKRRIIELATDDLDGIARANDDVLGESHCDMQLPSRLLRLLALPYRDRPGYREEWKP